ncbi:MAG: efflux RND transporter periplasmic adaptor subunit [Acetobacteraceae bacterium]|nr:efflux RND transporter periplasmic adaptor subunit [Acetobacteraceae bacterium]
MAAVALLPPGRGPLRAQIVAAPSAVPITVTRATVKDVPIEVRGLGTVQGFNSVLMRTRVDGTLMQVPVAEGQEVKPGELIAVVAPRPYKAALDQAMAKRQQDEAQQANARRDLARTNSLIKQDFASRQQMDTQQAQVDQLTAQIAGDQAAIEAAQLNLSFCYITSPIPGRVGLRQMDPGNIVHASDSGGILSITQDRPIAVLFTLPEQVLPEIMRGVHAGEKLPVYAWSGDEKTELDAGTLLTPDNSIDQSTGTIKLKAIFANPQDALWPGQFVEARLLLRTERNVLTLPNEAVQHGPDGLYVYVVKPDSTVAREAVEAEGQGDVSIIRKGLQAGQEVVLRGQSRLDNGMRVVAEEPRA